jgi:predicted GH43/DUF377 family glycosyl hydrolase
LSAPSVQRRLVSKGDLPGSDGGLFNPGAVLDGSTILLIARREVDLRATMDVQAERIRIDADTFAVLEHGTLTKASHLAGCRIEDFRCIRFEGKLLAVHSLVTGRRIKPVISRITDGRLEPFDALDLPIDIAPVEKNWVLFERGGQLHCLYKLDPLTIFVRAGRGTWELLKEEENGWADEFPCIVSNSANPIPFAGGHLGFWHTILGTRYVQGAFLLGPDLTITRRTGILLDGAEVRDGFKPGVLYVSALVAHRDRVLAIYGEADTHTSVAVFAATTLAEELRRSPFRPVDAFRISYDGRAPSPFVRAMWTVRSFCASRPGSRVRLYVDDPRLQAIASLFKIPNLAIRGERRRPVCHYRLAEDDPASWAGMLGISDQTPDPLSGYWATPAT